MEDQLDVARRVRATRLEIVQSELVHRGAVARRLEAHTRNADIYETVVGGLLQRLDGDPKAARACRLRALALVARAEEHR